MVSDSRRETLVIAALCIAWYAASSASNVVGKLVLTEFPFPLTVTIVQLLGTVLLSAPALSICGVRRVTDLTPGYYWRVLVPLAFLKFLTTVFGQVSIWKVPVSYAHTVKATTPLWTATLAYVLFGEKQPAAVQGALLLIAGGVCVASVTELQFDAIGLGAALGAASMLSLQHLYSKRVMKDSGIHHLRLLQILSKVALVMFLPVWAWWDGWALWRTTNGDRGDIVTSVAPLLALDGALAWLQAVLAFSVLSRITPLAYGVASAAKRAVVVAASLLFLRNPASLPNVGGMALALLGVLMYNRAKVHARLNAPKPLLPV